MASCLATPLMAQSALTGIPTISKASGVGPTMVPLPQMLQEAGDDLKAGKAQDAEDVLQKAAILYPDNFQVAMALTTTAMSLDHYQIMADSATKAVALNENSPQAYYFLAYAQNSLKNYSDAQIAISHSLAIMPELPSDILAGNIYGSLEQYHNAINAYQNAIGQDPDNLDAHLSIASIYAQLNDNEDSLEEYKASDLILGLTQGITAGVKTELEHQIVSGEAIAYANLGKTNIANNLLNPLIDVKQPSKNSLSTLANLYDIEHRYPDAIKVYQQLEQIDPKDGVMWGNLGWVEYENGDYGDALKYSEKALSIDKTLAYVQFNIGLIRAVQGSSYLSASAYKSAVKESYPFDIQSGANDVMHALKSQPNNQALKSSLQYLENAVISKSESEE